MRKSEGRLSFDFHTALGVDQPEVMAQPLKCVDFVALEANETWMIEVTEAERATETERRKAISQLRGQLRSDALLKDSLMKLYGTHAQMAMEGKRPTRKVHFTLIIGLPESDATGRQRNLMRDQMQRVTNAIGPSFFGTANRPIIRVETIRTWNEAVRHIQIE